MFRRPGVRLCLAAALVPLAACAGAVPASPGASAFSAELVPDPGSGWQIPVLRYTHPVDAARSIEVRVAPQAGSNLYSLRYGADELLVQPERLVDLKAHRTGTPVLYPTPNRVRGGRFTFGGRTFSFPVNSGGNFIHGLVRDLAWEYGAPVAGRDGAGVRTWIEWGPDQPRFASFPIRHRLEMRFDVTSDGVRIGYAVENLDTVALPYGFGLHPWFRVPGARDAVYLQVPAPYWMEAVDKLPTGTLVAQGERLPDLRQPTPLTALELDDVYFGVSGDAAPRIELRDAGIGITLGGSEEFGHVVVYTPAGRPFFCVENQTSSTDAHNLHARGFEEASGLRVVPPGGRDGGHVFWRVERLRYPGASTKS